MKKLPFIVLFSCLLLGCNRTGTQSHDNQLQEERDSLQLIAISSQEELQKMTSFFDEIAACIDSISINEALIVPQVYKEQSGKRVNSRELIEKLNLLADVITAQKEKIACLVDSLNNRVDTTRTSGLRNTINFLTNQLSQKEDQIQRLKAELNGQQKQIKALSSKVNQLTTTVGTLESQNTELTEAVKYQTEVINEGYVLVADKKRLMEMGLLEGGFLKKTKTNLDKIDLSKCSKVNIATFSELPLNAKSIKILSTAPKSSYIISSDGNKTLLKVTDPNSFWSISNILVIQTNN